MLFRRQAYLALGFDSDPVTGAVSIPSASDGGRLRVTTLRYLTVLSRLAHLSVIGNGTAVRVRIRPNDGINLTAEEVADGILAREISDQKNKEIEDWDGRTGVAYGVLDPSAFSQDGGPSIAERMSRRGVFFRGADNARVAQRGSLGGWDMVRARLIGEDGRPMMYFFSNCWSAIEHLPALQHDPDRPEDVLKKGPDHTPDEIRYACMSRPYVKDSGYKERGKILSVGPLNEVTLQDLWDKQPKKETERV